MVLVKKLFEHEVKQPDYLVTISFRDVVRMLTFCTNFVIFNWESVLSITLRYGLFLGYKVISMNSMVCMVNKAYLTYLSYHYKRSNNIDLFTTNTASTPGPKLYKNYLFKRNFFFKSIDNSKVNLVYKKTLNNLHFRGVGAVGRQINLPKPKPTSVEPCLFNGGVSHYKLSKRLFCWCL